MKCPICNREMERETFEEAAPDIWVGDVPADDEIVFVCHNCGEIRAK